MRIWHSVLRFSRPSLSLLSALDSEDPIVTMNYNDRVKIRGAIC